MKKYYRMKIYEYPNGDSFDWVVEYPDLLGCVGVGDTIKEALIEAEINKKLWLEVATEIGMKIPLPTCSRRFPFKIYGYKKFKENL